MHRASRRRSGSRLIVDRLSPFLIAAVVAAAGVWLLARLASQIGAVSIVRSDRWHATGEIPRLAGPAILLAMSPWLAGGSLVVLAVICAIGTVDDIHSLNPGVKAAALAAAALVAGLITGSPWVPIAIWVAANAVNMLDHADGLAGCTMAAAFLGIGGADGLAGAGACVGFLFLNYPPARVFMGDSGSLVLGAAVVLATFDKGVGLTLAWTAIPLVDAAFVVTRRLLAGRKPWIGGTDHLGHTLLSLGVPSWFLPIIYAGVTLTVGLAVEAAT